MSNHRKARPRRVLTLGTANAADCTSGITFTRSDTPAAVGDNPGMW